MRNRQNRFKSRLSKSKNVQETNVQETLGLAVYVLIRPTRLVVIYSFTIAIVIKYVFVDIRLSSSGLPP